MSANQRHRLASETEEERAARLQQMSANQRHRLASETEEERAARLQQMSANQCHRLATETEEERAARLQRMRDRLASETEEERAARLQQMSANQHHRMAAETGSEREARLQRNREGQRGQQSQLPLFEQPSVQAKMRKFYAEIAALEMQKCTTCSERFPGLQLRSHSTEALLPEDDDLSGLHSMTVDSPSDDSELSSTQDVDLYDANLSRTFLPLTPSRLTEQEAIRHSVQERQSNLPSTVA